MLASLIDIGLKLLFAITIGLIVFQFFHIYWFRKRRAQPTAVDVVCQEASRQASASVDHLAGMAAQRTAEEEGFWPLNLLGTIASTAPFLGLIGTVVHIIDALGSLAGAASDVRVVAGPIATALYATLWGLGAAVPATVVYNLVCSRLRKEHDLAVAQAMRRGGA